MTATTNETRAVTLTMVAQGIAHLARLDPDRAFEINGAGFSKNDVLIGHELADAPLPEWDDEMLAWGYSRCRKYHRQLDEAFGDGFTDTIPPVPVEIEGEGPRWWEKRREAKRRAEETSWQRAERERREAEAEAKRERAAAKERELTKPCTIALVAEKSKYGETMVRFDYPFVWGSAATDKAMAEVKALPKRFFNGDNPADKHWRAPLTLENCTAILALVAAGWQWADGAAAQAVASGLEERQREVAQKAAAQAVAAVEEAQTQALSRAASADFHVPGLLREPYPFQRAGIKFAAERKRVLVADEPGLGKTIQAIGTVVATGAFPALVICPAAVKYNWEREWHATVGGLRVVVLDGRKAAPLQTYKDADVLILNYDIVGPHAIAIEQHARPKSLIVDESHYIKNKKAERTQQVKILARGREVRLLLTGTPVLNRPQELLAQLEVLDRVKDVVGADWKRPEWRFLQHYCGAYQDAWGWHFDGAENTQELHTRLVSTCMIRRAKADVLPDLPPKTRTILQVDLTNRAEYDRAEKDLVNFLAGMAVEERAFVASLAGLSREEAQQKRREHYDSKAQQVKKAEQLVRFNALKQLAVKGKMKAIQAWAEDFLASGEKLVVMGWHRETVKTLAEVFHAPTVMGGDDAQAKDRAVQAFQHDPATRVIACNIIAAGEGITLTASSNTLFTELGWNPGKMEQAEDRIHRIGQKSAQVTCWYLLGKDTIDEQLMDIIETKRKVVRAVTDGEALVDDDESVLDALTQRMLQGMDDKALRAAARKAK